jgi:hypothetical protein
LSLGALEVACAFPLADDLIGNRITAAVVPRRKVADEPTNTRASPAHLRAKQIASELG